MAARPEITGRNALGGVRAVYSVPEAGRILGIGRNAAYEAAARGEIPVIKIGRLLKVPKVAFDRMLAQAGATASEAKVA